MCGICGLFNFSKKRVSHGAIQEMTESIKHRGRDSEGLFLEKNLGLGFCRLAIVDIETGDQPIASEDENFVVIMNGEIYNHQELRLGLEAKGHRFRTNSDAEVLLHLYEDYGVAMLEKLNGMFAFALFDRNANELLIARDRVGVKPLYYSNNDKCFSFSSDARCLIDKRNLLISKKELINYLGFGYTSAGSIFENVKKVPPAHYVKVSTSGVRFQRYWSIKGQSKSYRNVRALTEELDFLISDALTLQSVSAVKKGLFLSGGIDSSALLAISSDLNLGSLETFSLQYENKQSDDIYFAQKLSERFGTNHHILSLDQTKAREVLDCVLKNLDEPLADSALIGTYALSSLASQLDVKVLLSGAGADELFGGYARYHPNKSKDFILRLFSALPDSVKEKISSDFNLRTKDRSVDYVSKISGVDFVFLKNVLFDEVFEDLMVSVANVFAPVSGDQINIDRKYREMFCDMNGYLPFDILSITDKASMSVPVEVRVPFLDHRLIEFAFSIPAEYNMLGGEPKGLFKALLQDKLPSSLLERKKSGFNAPVRNWRNGKDCLQTVDGLLASLSDPLKDVLDLRKFEKTKFNGQCNKRSAQTLYSLKLFNDWYNVNFGWK